MQEHTHDEGEVRLRRSRDFYSQLVVTEAPFLVNCFQTIGSRGVQVLEPFTVKFLRSVLELRNQVTLLCCSGPRRQDACMNSISGRTPQDQLCGNCPRRISSQQAAFSVASNNIVPTYTWSLPQSLPGTVLERWPRAGNSCRLTGLRKQRSEGYRSPHRCSRGEAGQWHRAGQPALLLAFQLGHSAAADGQRTFFGL
jgi:hypothetical protein